MVNNNYDSILTAQDTNVVNTSTYYKAGKDLPDHGVAMAERPYAAATDDFILCGLFLLTILISVLLYRGRAIIAYRLKEFFTTRRTYSDEDVNENNHEVYSTFFLMSISALGLSMLAFDYVERTVGFDRVVGIPYWLFAAGYVVFIGVIYLKAWLYALINWTFYDQDSNDKWMEGYLLLTSLSAYVVLPLSTVGILVEESREIVISGLVFLFILYELLLFFKLIVNFGGKSYSYFLIFLYFCSVEIIPAIIMYRIMSWAMSSFIVKIMY